MDTQSKKDLIEEQAIKQAYSSAGGMQDEIDEAIGLLKVMTDNNEFLQAKRMEYLGLATYINPDGERLLKQVKKPIFCKVGKDDIPIKVFNKKTQQYEYVAVEEGIDEIINLLSNSGFNQVTPLTIIDENIIRADLMELQSKWVVTLCINRKKWGVAKSMYPLYCSQINTLIQDARYRAKDGASLRTLRTITNRIEQTSQDDSLKKKSIGDRMQSPFVK